ncbi:Fe-S-containing protein [Serpentinicella alkaliphila]|uniref:Putative membrane protein DUF2318 n=1 Tax=Serpentinicella alkaliphila TaxID=1734049 RepID=A0A4R2TUT7_9FIRM|nr:Fe-S-containing protein [Serpentinicella alkaliphila]QUH25618.1 DUF2318 domain-containing protein [Serpentinicella alkaliphila]TCQ06672.1 putative membrane protein DUF2318 [Serpentinicella alkaliphila]
MSKQYQSKKEQFTTQEKRKLPIILTAVGLVLITLIFFVMRGTNEQEKVEYFGNVVAAERSYIGEFISMTVVEPVVADGKIEIDFEEVNTNNIVYFEVENNENQLVPLMAYITPSGRLFTGSSMCEPCRGRTFSLAGETLVCDACRTTYTIEEHKFISGSKTCGQYPPVQMNNRIEDGKIVIDLDEVLQWRIRS